MFYGAAPNLESSRVILRTGWVTQSKGGFSTVNSLVGGAYQIKLCKLLILWEKKHLQSYLKVKYAT